MTYDFRHAAMHTIADWPVLERIVTKSSDAKRLDSRTGGPLGLSAKYPFKPSGPFARCDRWLPLKRRISRQDR